jgi:hypothetical protein
MMLMSCRLCLALASHFSQAWGCVGRGFLLSSLPADWVQGLPLTVPSSLAGSFSFQWHASGHRRQLQAASLDYLQKKVKFPLQTCFSNPGLDQPNN